MTNARKILVADADPAVRKRFEEVLSGKGYAVTTASSGEDALWQLGNDAYDAVVTDIVMRGMSGLDVAEEIRARELRLPVVLISGDGSGAARERAAAAGIAEVLQKPPSPEQVASAVARVLQATGPVAALRPQAPVAKVVPAQAISGPLARLKNIVLFLLAPFIGLVYILIFPVVGLGMLASSVQQEPEKAETLQPAAPVNASILRNAPMMLVVALFGVACAVIGPILGIGLLLWFSFEAWGRLGARAMRG